MDDMNLIIYLTNGQSKVLSLTNDNTTFSIKNGELTLTHFLTDEETDKYYLFNLYNDNVKAQDIEKVSVERSSSEYIVKNIHYYDYTIAYIDPDGCKESLKFATTR